MAVGTTKITGTEDASPAGHRIRSAAQLRSRGRPRDERLDAAILAAAEAQLEKRGYAGMSLESVAAAAGTTVPSVRRRYGRKAELAVAVVDSLRIAPLAAGTGAARDQALAILQNFQRNLERPRAMATLGSILSEEERNPVLLDRFRTHLARPRREMLADALAAGVAAGLLPKDFDIDAAVSNLIGSFYARYITGDVIPDAWAERTLNMVWPD